MRDSFNDLTLKELWQKREDLKKEYRETRYNKVIGHLDNPLKIRNLRRKLARINTIIHEFDLEIRQEKVRK